MSNTANDHSQNESDIKKAAEQVDSQQIAQNLEADNHIDAPEQLSEDEQTSFINDELRTDK